MHSHNSVFMMANFHAVLHPVSRKYTSLLGQLIIGHARYMPSNADDSRDVLQHRDRMLMLKAAQFQISYTSFVQQFPSSRGKILDLNSDLMGKQKLNFPVY